MHRLLVFIVSIIVTVSAICQDIDSLPQDFIDYSKQKEYVIVDLQIKGVKYLNANHLKNISGLRVGQKIEIPSQELSEAVRNYWNHGLFSDVKIIVSKIEEKQVWLEIYLQERPRLSELKINGIRKGEQNDLKETIGLKPGNQVTEDILNKVKTIIKKHYVDKGYLNAEVDVIQKNDTSLTNRVFVQVDVRKNDRVKITDISFDGNTIFKDSRLRRVMKKTKKKNLNIFKSSKLVRKDYKEDKQKLMDFYNERGYRDARILDEKIENIKDKRISIKLNLFEGNKYFIRDIRWIGNTKYSSEFLGAVLGIKEGDIYDKSLMEERLQMDEDAVSSVYLDNGYLFFNVNPVEVRIENDSVDLEMRIYEGEQATINRVNITGNTKTNEHVARRELYTRPGELFSKSDIIRSVRELATLGHFNPETINPVPIPNQADGTVDLEYQLEERANDQLEVSGGWGGIGFVGTVGVRFSNFSARGILNHRAWRPVPSGDGQTLQLQVRTQGRAYQSYGATFIEPWFGGKKPNAFSVSVIHTIQRQQTYDRWSFKPVEDSLNRFFKTIGVSVGLRSRLKWPDDFFSAQIAVNIQQYHLNNYNIRSLDAGRYNLLSLTTGLTRSSIDQFIYPRRGSVFNLVLQTTPPYSLFDKRDYSELPFDERFKMIEFHKWTFDAAWYTSLIGNLVLATKAEFGYLGFYNKDIGAPPFEKFVVGGSGLSGYNLFGSDIVPLRGYPDGDITPDDNGNLYTRYYVELRYPFSLNPSATIYGLAFVEGGNAWSEWSSFNPFAIKRSAGIGVRAFLPMFGLLGIDWAYGFDPILTRDPGPEFHFIIGQQL